MIIGITGYIGSGKSTVAELFHKKGFEIVEMRDAVVEEMKRKGMEINSRSLRDFSTMLREKYGKDIVARLTYRKIKKEKGKDIAITGMRTTYEEAYFRKRIKGFRIIAVSAPEMMRFKRIKNRNKPDDPKTLKEFRDIEQKEINGFSERKDEAHGIKRLMDHSDFVIFNTGTLRDLEKSIRELIEFLEDLEKNGS